MVGLESALTIALAFHRLAGGTRPPLHRATVVGNTEVIAALILGRAVLWTDRTR